MAQKGSVPKQHIIKAGATPITTSAYVELDAALDGDTNHIEVYNTTTKILLLAQGPAGSEDDMFFIPAEGNGRMMCKLDLGVRLSVKAVDADTTAGQLIINLWG